MKNFLTLTILLCLLTATSFAVIKDSVAEQRWQVDQLSPKTLQNFTRNITPPKKLSANVTPM